MAVAGGMAWQHELSPDSLCLPRPARRLRPMSRVDSQPHGRVNSVPNGRPASRQNTCHALLGRRCSPWGAQESVWDTLRHLLSTRPCYVKSPAAHAGQSGKHHETRDNGLVGAARGGGLQRITGQVAVGCYLATGHDQQHPAMRRLGLSQHWRTTAGQAGRPGRGLDAHQGQCFSGRHS
jgi:hypothetical protein